MTGHCNSHTAADHPNRLQLLFSIPIYARHPGPTRCSRLLWPCHAGHVSAVIVHSATSHLPDDPPGQRILFVYLRFLTNITKRFHKTLSRPNGCEHLARTHFRPVTARNGTTWHVLVLHTPLLPPHNVRNMLNLAVLVFLVFPMSLSHLIPSRLIRHPLRCLEMPKDSSL